MGLSARRPVLVALGLLSLLVLGRATREVASLARPPLDFDIGPSTGSYLDGFTESEERLPLTFRWTRERAEINLPVEGRGSEARLKIRLARFLRGSAQVRVFVNGEPAGSFSARSGRFRTVELPVRLDPNVRSLSLLVEDPNPERLGVAIDWVRIENARWHLTRSTVGPPLFLAGVFALGIALGFSLPVALGLGGLFAVGQALWFAWNPFAMAHVHTELTALALLSAALLVPVFHRGPLERWVPILFVLGLLLKGSALFHPSYFYSDVRLHRRHLEVMQETDGNLIERSITAQKTVGTAYPRRIAGRKYAFPYSPIFYVPFLGLDRDARATESIMKRTGLLLASLELPLVFVLARHLLGTGTAVWAALMVAFLPPITSRLLFAQWPTLAGHLLDVVAIACAARLVKRPETRRPLIVYGLSGFLACLTYISSLINLSLFTTFLATIVRDRALRLLAIWSAIGLATVLLLYLPFITSLFTEILPAITASAAEAATEPGKGILDALDRVYIFYGIGFPALAVAGFVLSRRDSTTFRLLAVYGMTFLALLALRSASGTFKDLKELVFIGPFVAITTGASLEALRARGGSGRFAAILVAIGLVGFGVSKLAEYTALHTVLAGIE